jgi:Bacterial Ig-like domain (group 3)
MTTYTYDALGRLKRMQVSGGVLNGVQESYDYDLAGNRLLRQTLPATSSHPTNVATPAGAANLVGQVTTLIVNVNGTGPSGTVSVYVDGIYVGSVEVVNGQARIRAPGIAPGAHSITATYSGDASNDPSSSTFAVQVRDISWLPALIESILN